MHRHAFKAGALASAIAACFNAAAQTPAEPKPAQKMESVIVTASPLGAGETEMTQPVTVLYGDELRRKQAASLGDTVGRELGVQSSSFGPAAGRPIIRGMDGARIRVMQGGVDTLDVSAISPDHMVATDTLNARQVEILRGPASLLYGSGAIGGVVNVVNGLIPNEVPRRPTGSWDLRATDANDGEVGAVDVTMGGGEFAMNANGFSRRAKDYESPFGIVENSDLHARGGGIGGSWVSGQSYAGVGVSTLKNDYGIPSPEGARIKLEQTRWDGAGELANPFAGVTRMKFRVGHNDYQHQEIESSGEVATTFKNEAWDTRVEFGHVPWEAGKGALGFHYLRREFSALGEEATIPRTYSNEMSVFLVEQKRWDAWTVDGGVRLEREERRPDGGLPERNFSLASFALGASWKLTPGIELAVNVTHAERAPAIEELYSNGAHHATETFDIGDPNLQEERSRNLDLTLRGKHGASSWKVSAFASRVKDYVYQASVDADGDGIADRVNEEGDPEIDGELLVQQSTQADARFHGIEGEWRYRPEGDGFGGRIFGDYVRGKLSNGENLPRMSPGRIGAELDARFGPWGGNVSVMRVSSQSKVAPLESTTPGYTRFDAEVTYTFAKTPIGSIVAFLQGANLSDEEAMVHTSYLKEFAPLMGRAWTAGVRGEF